MKLSDYLYSFDSGRAVEEGLKTYWDELDPVFFENAPRAQLVEDVFRSACALFWAALCGAAETEDVVRALHLDPFEEFTGGRD